MRLRLFILLVSLTLPLLAITRKVRIYNEQTGVKMEIAFKFTWNSTHGQIVGNAPSGGAVGWGQIYSGGKTATVTTMSVGDRRGSLFASDRLRSR